MDILNGNFEEDTLDNVLVLVGATAFGLDDIVPTHIAVIHLVLSYKLVCYQVFSMGKYLSPSGKGLIGVVISSSSWHKLFLAVRRGRYAMLGLPVMVIGAPFIALGIHGFALINYSLWIGWIGTALFGSLVSSILLIVEHARVRIERSRVVQNLISYLPAETAQRVAFESPSSLIQAERSSVTLLSADLRNFSAIGERRPPEESAAILHYFFTKINQIVERHGGRIHEYKGDSVLAVWDGDGVAPASDALNASIEIEREINSTLLNEIGVEGLEPLAVGIGIEQGPVLRGSIGPAMHGAHTLCGETVSVALRIQEMTADLSYPILIGEVAARYLRCPVKIEALHFAD